MSILDILPHKIKNYGAGFQAVETDAGMMGRLIVPQTPQELNPTTVENALLHWIMFAYQSK